MPKGTHLGSGNRSWVHQHSRTGMPGAQAGSTYQSVAEQFGSIEDLRQQQLYLEDLFSRVVKVEAPAGGATIDMQVAVAGVGVVTPTALSRTRGLQVAVAGLGTVTPARLVLTRPLQVAINGSGAVSPSITVAGTVTLQVATNGAGTVAAAFSLQKSLRAGIAGVGTVVPAKLSLQEPLAVAMQGVGTITPTLRGTFALATQIAEAGVVSPTLSVSTPVGSGGPGGGANAGAFVPALLPFLRRKR